MQSQQIVEVLQNDTHLFTATVYEAPHHTPEEIVRLGEPRHYWRVRLDPRVSFDPTHGQWLLDGLKTDERVVRSVVVKSFLGRRHNFNGADIALALDVLKVVEGPTYRKATDTEFKAATATGGAR